MSEKATTQTEEVKRRGKTTTDPELVAKIELIDVMDDVPADMHAGLVEWFGRRYGPKPAAPIQPFRSEADATEHAR